MKQINLVEAILFSASLEIKRNNAYLHVLVARWSHQTHTSILKNWRVDVAFLLLLGSRGRNRFDPFSLTAEDEAMIVELKVCI